MSPADAILKAERELDFELTKAQFAQLHDQLSILMVRAAHKWVAGQREHGGNIVDRDLKKEIIDEAIDMTFYALSLPE